MNTSIQYVVPIILMVLLSFVLVRTKWLQKAGFTKQFIVFFFIAKCVAGFTYNFIALHYIPNRGDIWPYFEDGRQMYQTFLASPHTFFQTFSHNFRYTDMDATNTNSDFARSAFGLIKIFQFLMSFISFGSLAGNTVLFNFLVVLCFFYYWKFLRQQLSHQGVVAGLIFFLFPSMFFYSAGIFKEGFIISLLCLLIPLSYQLLKEKFSLKTIVSWLLCFAILFFIKFFVALTLVFCLVVWWLLLSFPKHQWVVLVSCLIMAMLLFFGGHFISPALDFAAYMVKRQQEFLALPAASAIPVAPLSTNPLSFLEALPSAINNVLFKPLPGEGGKLMYLFFSVEMIIFWLAILYMVLHSVKERAGHHQKLFAVIFFGFALLNLLFIGLIIPNIGAIMRYRSIFIPFMLLFTLIITGWKPALNHLYGRLAKLILR